MAQRKGEASKHVKGVSKFFAHICSKQKFQMAQIKLAAGCCGAATHQLEKGFGVYRARTMKPTRNSRNIGVLSSAGTSGKRPFWISPQCEECLR